MTLLLTLFHYLWSFALIISVVVFVHEFGHYLVARLCGVGIESFSIGFGRELVGRTDRHGTRWKLAAFPLGGYVKMVGDASAASTPDLEALAAMSDAEKKRSLHHQPLWAKALIVVAGPAANFVLSILVFTALIYSYGVTSTEPVVGEVMPNTPAATAGLQPGDRVLSVDGKTIRVFDDIPSALITNLYTPVAVVIEHGGTTKHLTLTPIEYEEKDASGNVIKRPLIGIRSKKVTFRDVTLPEALWVATQGTYDLCAKNLYALSQIISGDRSAKQLTGTLGIAKLSGDVTRQGDTVGETIVLILNWIAKISVGIGLVNLFPLPMLDGGHLLFYAIEAVRGRAASERVMEFCYRLGLALILMLMVFTFYNDATRIFFS